MGNLSDHFDMSEFRDHRTGEVHVDPRLVMDLEKLRSIIGNRPITIVSGFRSPATNRAVGGAPNSQHLYGRAADISDQLRVTVDQAVQAGFTGIGWSPHSHFVVHVDVRPGPLVSFVDG